MRPHALRRARTAVLGVSGRTSGGSIARARDRTGGPVDRVDHVGTAGYLVEARRVGVVRVEDASSLGGVVRSALRSFFGAVGFAAARREAGRRGFPGFRAVVRDASSGVVRGGGVVGTVVPERVERRVARARGVPRARGAVGDEMFPLLLLEHGFEKRAEGIRRGGARLVGRGLRARGPGRAGGVAQSADLRGGGRDAVEELRERLVGGVDAGDEAGDELHRGLAAEHLLVRRRASRVRRKRRGRVLSDREARGGGDGGQGSNAKGKVGG